MVSIVIPMYNAEKYIRKCIQSVIKQNYNDIEIIIIDDGSTDNSLKICEEFQRKDSRIIIKTLTKNYGLPHARDVGVQLARGEFIAFVDADDYIPTNAIAIRVKNIGDADLLISNYIRLDENGKIVDKIELQESTTSNIDILNHLFCDYKYGFQGYRWNKLFRKNILNKCNFSYDKIFYNEDRLFVCIYLLECKKVKIIPDITYYYLKRKESMTGMVEFNYKLITGLDGFSVMSELLKKNYVYSYCMCCLNSYYCADSILKAIPSNDVITKKYLRKYMVYYRNCVFSNLKNIKLKYSIKLLIFEIKGILKNRWC